MNTKDENILFNKFCELYDSTKNSPNPPDPFTFWVRINNDSKKDYISGRFNSSSNVGIVSVGSRNTIRAISFQFNEKSKKVSILFADDTSRIEEKSGLSKKIVNSFISTLKKKFESWNQDYTNIDDTLIQAIYNEYCLFFRSVITYDKKYKTNFYDILKIKPEEFEKNIETHKKKYKTLVEEENGDSNDNNETSHPLNLILYGPPGTGKTYNTIAHAIAICDGADSINHGLEFDKTGVPQIKDFKKAKIRYDELKDAGQIDFTTFHQSLSYEDFIEGIKPITGEGEEIKAIHENDPNSKKNLFGAGTTIISNLSTMKYKVRDGIFRKISDNANRNRQESESKEGNSISVQDLLNAFCNDAEEKDEDIYLIKDNKKWHKISPQRKDNENRDVQYFVVKYGSEQHLTLSIINRDWKSFKKGEIKNASDIKPKSGNQPQHGNATYYFALYKALEKFEKEHKPTQQINVEKRNFVLIIDEINRGNVAQIFGELITLIEPSKRLGNDEAMTVTLPYSSTVNPEAEPFGVPNNLYIIGTMNTADRSVEALDTALRRRFSFEEMMPKPELLTKIELTKGDPTSAIDLKEVLEKINDRIIVLKDREHQIGHSYFMGHDDKNEDGSDKYPNKEEWLTNVFKDKIIPLLQEYFYGDYKKIYYVLGPGFIENSFSGKNQDSIRKELFPFVDSNDQDFDISEERYEIRPFDDDFKDKKDDSKDKKDNKVVIKAAIHELINSEDYQKMEKNYKEKKFLTKDGEKIDVKYVIERIFNGEPESNFTLEEKKD